MRTSAGRLPCQRPGGTWPGALGLYPNTTSVARTREAATALALDTSHFRRSDGRSKVRPPLVVEGTAAQRRARLRESQSWRYHRTWSDEELVTAVGSARSWAEVHRRLGIEVGGSTYRRLQERAADLGLDTSHFSGRRWATGRANPLRVTARPLQEILVEDSDYDKTHELRRRLLREGLKGARCESCGKDEWNGRPTPLQLDHVNGNRRDNRLENLRILCPNCHAQTDTWCGKNIRR